MITKQITKFLQNATFENFGNCYTPIIIRWTNSTIFISDTTNNHTRTKRARYVTMFDNQIKLVSEVHHDWWMSISDVFSR